MHADVEGIVLLGSTATGDLTPASDYDVMIVLAAADGLAIEVTAVEGRLTDVLILDVAMLRRAADREDELANRVCEWISSGRIVFDRSGDVDREQRRASKSVAPTAVAADIATAERWQVSYDLLVNENYARSDDAVYLLALRLRLLHSFSRLLLAYFRVRAILWQGEKAALRLLEATDPAFLGLVVAWLDAVDPKERVALHRRAAEEALEPAGGVWPVERFPVGQGTWERLAGAAP